jgi:predicted glycosyltransferase
MRVWIDMTNSPHVVLFRPLVRLLQDRGHEVHVSARAFAQTLELLDLAGIEHDVVGPPHGGGSRAGKARAMGARLLALRRWAASRRPEVALSHASHELPLTARSLGIPSTYAFDYEYARVQHGLGARAATRVVVPEAIPQERLDALGAHRAKVRRYPGLKEEYALHGRPVDPTVAAALGLDPSRLVVVVRTPPEVALYHRHGNDLLADVLERLAGDPAVQAVVLPRTPDQRVALAERWPEGLVVPEVAVDAHSLMAAADLVVSAGGTMNREAAALGTPVVTTFAGRLGAVDEQLVRDGRLAVLRTAEALPLERRPHRPPSTRDPGLLLDLLLGVLDSGSAPE